MSYNSINFILTTNKSIKPIYVDWKRNLDIVLTLEELKLATQEIASLTFNEHSTQEEKNNYNNC